MWFEGVELCCPHCRDDLLEDGTDERVLRCRSCARSYPVELGIPDLRVFPDPYIDVDADRAKARHLAERYPDTDFEGLVRYYYSITPAVPPEDAERYTRGLLSGVARARSSLRSWGFAGGEDATRFLDLGCGTAPLLVAAQSGHRHLCGVDIAFRWLAVARKRLTEAGLQVPLVCACAEALPFPDAHFDRIGAESVLETVRDQAVAAAEAHRVLRPGGSLGLTTPNRFSLGPDPHVALWATGFLPESAVAWYARRRGAVPPVRNLLSVRTLRKLLTGAGFRRIRVGLPRIPDEQITAAPPLRRMLMRLYRLLTRLPVARNALFAVGPILHAVGQRLAAPAGSDPRPPRPASSG